MLLKVRTSRGESFDQFYMEPDITTLLVWSRRRFGMVRVQAQDGR